MMELHLVDEDEDEDDAVVKRDEDRSTDNQMVEEWVRSRCPRCSKRASFYCVDCYEIVGAPKGCCVPMIDLPLRCSIVFFDKIRKSTAVHAKMLAPDHVDILQYPDAIPRIDDPQRVAVAYPSDDSTTFEEWDLKDLAKLRRIILIDSPWKKSSMILNHEGLEGLRRVRLARPPEKSRFWRWHKAGHGALSTIEAIHYLLAEYVSKCPEENRTPSSERHCIGGRSRVLFDSKRTDLLFFFELMRKKIARFYATDEEYQDVPLPYDEDGKRAYRYKYNQRLKKKLAAEANRKDRG